MGIVAALGNTVTNIVIATAIIIFRSMSVSRAPKPTSGAALVRAGGAAVRQQRSPHFAAAYPATPAHHDVQISLTMAMRF